MMELKSLHFPTRAKLRQWLKENQRTSTGVWIISYKKHTGEKSILYNDAARETIEVKRPKIIRIPEEIRKTSSANESAWDNFNSLAQSYKRQYLFRPASARTEETQLRRIEETIRFWRLISNSI
jgi:uncharacterized protein YdeI (YjbR/CyaY-like superfamily)